MNEMGRVKKIFTKLSLTSLITPVLVKKNDDSDCYH